MQNFIKQDIHKLLEKEEQKLRNKQEIAMLALIKRIQRDRNEQLMHRKVDSRMIIRRTKNLIQHLQKNQEMELKKTKDYLLHSLGTRAPAGKQNPKSRSQSNKKKIKRIHAIEVSNDLKDQKSFFITDRGSHQISQKQSVSKSLTKNKLQNANRSTSVNVSKILNQKMARSKMIDSNQAYHNRSDYGLKGQKRIFKKR